MIVIYTPKGGEPQHYDATVLKVSEASILQRTVDMKWQEVLQGLEQDDLDAMRGIVWVIRKRSEPSLRWGDFDPGVTELTARMDNEEIERWIGVAVASADAELSWETIERIIGDRIPDAAVDPERALAILSSRAPSPKDQTPDADSELAPEQSLPDQSLSPTSTGPETATSPSSPTSSTSSPEPLTT